MGRGRLCSGYVSSALCVLKFRPYSESQSVLVADDLYGSFTHYPESIEIYFIFLIQVYKLIVDIIKEIGITFCSTFPNFKKSSKGVFLLRLLQVKVICNYFMYVCFSHAATVIAVDRYPIRSESVHLRVLTSVGSKGTCCFFWSCFL